jgi:molecular chaperone GrpE
MKKEEIDDKETQNEAIEDNSELSAEEEQDLAEEEIVEEDAEEQVDDEVAKEEVDELAEAKDKYLRLYSEFDNFRRRTAKEKLELIRTAGERIIIEMLPVLDDFGRAEGALDTKEEHAVVEGVKLISTKFKKILEDQGLKLMDTKPGTAFDPELHEAVTQIPAPSKKLKGKIVETIEHGYFLGDKVIRYAKVVIGA